MSNIDELVQMMKSCQETVEKELASQITAFRSLITKVFPGKQWKPAKDFYKSVDKKYTDDDMFWIYINAAGYQHFRPYAEQQDTINLLDFVNDCIKLKSLKGGSGRYKDESKKIFQRFLVVGGKEAIEIPPKFQEKLRAMVETF